MRRIPDHLSPMPAARHSLPIHLPFRETAGALVALAGLYLSLAQPFAPDLSPSGHTTAAGLFVALGFWIFKPFNLPLSIPAVLMLAIFLISGVPTATALSGYTSSAVWIMMPALFFGFALIRTGLGRRIALLILQQFKPSYLGLMLAWALIGIILSILTPSTTVRIALLTPIAVTSCDLLSLPNGSKGRGLFLLTAISMAMIPGMGWMTGTLGGPTLLGMYNSVPELQGVLTFNTWAQVALPLTILTTILLVAGGYLFMKPKERDLEVNTREIYHEEYQQLGRWSRQEIWTAAILVGAFLFFVTGQIHKIPDVVICLCGFFLLAASGVITGKDISQGISWDIVIFLGAAISVGPVFTATGVTQWLSTLVLPALGGITANPWIFCYAVVIFLFAWRFVDIAIMIPTEAILVPMIPAIAAQYHIHPLIWIGLFILPINSLFLSYQNVFVLVGETIAGEKGWRPRQLAVYGMVYFAAGMIALAVSIPYWISLGFF
ncbi:MAG TPA: SLC13 family permease [Anaerolineaceae bacterium]